MIKKNILTNSNAVLWPKMQQMKIVLRKICHSTKKNSITLEVGEETKLVRYKFLKLLQD